MQKSLARGGQILGGKVSDVGNKVLDTVVQADPLLAATPAYGVTKAALGVTGTAAKVASSLGNAKTPDQAAGSLRDVYNGVRRPPLPAPGQEWVVDHSPAPLETAASTPVDI
jgi:hypothetical protein